MIGGGATAAGMGHVVVMDDSPAQLALTRYSQQFWQELVAELPADCEYDPCGTLWVAADEEELAAAREKEQTLRAHGIAAELLDARQLAEAEPQLRPGLAGGLVVPDDLVVYPPCVARWLIDQARAQGAELRLDCTGRVAGRRSRVAGRRHAAGCRRGVNAAGTAAVRLDARASDPPAQGPPGDHRSLSWLCAPPARRTRIHQERVGQRRPSRWPSTSSRGTRASCSSARRGSIDIESDAVEARDSAADALPRRSIIFRAWPGSTSYGPGPDFGPRPTTSCRSSGPGRRSAGLYLAAGHEGLGITTSLGTAALLADMLIGRA